MQRQRGNERGVHVYVINVVMKSLISSYNSCTLDLCCEQESTWTQYIKKKLFLINNFSFNKIRERWLICDIKVSIMK